MWKCNIGWTVGFQAILDQRLAFTTLDENWIAHALQFKRALLWRHVSLKARKQGKTSLRALLPVVYRPFWRIFGPRLEQKFKRSLTLLPRIPKWFNAFQVLKRSKKTEQASLWSWTHFWSTSKSDRFPSIYLSRAYKMASAITLQKKCDKSD